MSAFLGISSLIVFTPAVVGFLLGRSIASVWIPWTYVVGLPVAIGAIGVSMMSVGDTMGPDGYSTDRVLFGFLIVLAALVVFVAKLFGTSVELVCRDER